ncbi:MAG: hypothetical protein JWP87_5253 [Labilithrix sp.]|nr:hypothetical protein [Labilithrix sp.]
MGGKRTTTTQGLGAVRTTQKPARASRRAPPLTCPAPRVPQIEDIGAKRPLASRRGTIRQSTSSADDVKIDVASGAAARFASGTPKLTAKAAKLQGLALDPRDAFILSRIEGRLDAADLADLTGLAARDVVATLERLTALGLITME